MNITFSISTDRNALFDPAASICDECDAPAIAFLDFHDDEFCTSLCRTHLASTLSNLATDPSIIP
jgi:hypothetical protein